MATFFKVGRYFEKVKFTNGFRERRFIESLMIKNLKPNLNSQHKSKPLEIVFRLNQFNFKYLAFILKSSNQSLLQKM